MIKKFWYKLWTLIYAIALAYSVFFILEMQYGETTAPVIARLLVAIFTMVLFYGMMFWDKLTNNDE